MVSLLLDLLFPPSCLICGARDLYRPDTLICEACVDSIAFIAHPLCPCCGRPFFTESERDHLCGDCLGEEFSFTKVRALGRYEGSLATVIHRFKYRRKFAMAEIFKFLLGHYAPPDLDFSEYQCLVPVPLHPVKLRQRGFNQAVMWAELVSERYGVPLLRTVLKRIEATAPQVELQKKERERNVRGAFAVSKAEAIKGKTVLLLDDVCTTGATMRECARVLRNAGAFRVDGFVVARAG